MQPRTSAYALESRSPAAARPRGRADALAIAFRDLAAQDWLLGGYLSVLLVAVVLGGGPRRDHAITLLSIDLAVFVVATFVARARLFGRVVSAVVYRFALLFAILASFLQLQWILPAATSHLVDADLLALDLRLFGFEPSLSWDRFVSPTTTEWFSFFYFGYFPFLLLYVAAGMIAVRNTRLLAELSFGICWVFCVGHVLYLLVPGHGPYVHLADQFTQPLTGNVFWPLVRSSVDAVELSSRTDIFPSLHTAAPTFLAAFAFRHRKVPVLGKVWLPSALFASQVILATMFLRWHYAIDVCAGLAHGLGGGVLAARIVAWETERRERMGSAPVWTTPW